MLVIKIAILFPQAPHRRKSEARPGKGKEIDRRIAGVRTRNPPQILAVKQGTGYDAALNTSPSTLSKRASILHQIVGI
jgi:hypothetical protein